MQNQKQTNQPQNKITNNLKQNHLENKQLKPQTNQNQITSIIKASKIQQTQQVTKLTTQAK